MLINKNTIIYGENIILVPYKECHVLKYNSWMQSEELLELTGSERLTLEEEYANQISWRIDEKKCTFIILDKKIYNHSGKNEIESMVGDVNLFLYEIQDEEKEGEGEKDKEEEKEGEKKEEEKEKSAEIEIMIAERNARRKGFGKEAIFMMIKFGIENLKIKNFFAKIGISNSASLGLFTKLGFQEVSKSDVFQEITLKLQITELFKNVLEKQKYEIVSTV